MFSSKTARPRAPSGARCMRQAIRTWSAVCSGAPHSQFNDGARPHSYIDEWNCPTLVCRHLSLTQPVRGKLNPTGLALVMGTKARAWMCLHSIPGSIYNSYTEKRGFLVRQGYLRDSASSHKRRLDLSFSGEHLRNHVKDHTAYGQDPEFHGKLRKVSPPVAKV